MTIPDKGTQIWNSPTLPFELRPNCVQVWLADLNQPPTFIEAFRVTLEKDEQDRAARFRFEHDRVRFIAAHGILRQLLATFLKVSPDDVRFRYDEYGKPHLSQGHESSCVKFNISHSGQRGLFAFAIGRELGLDIERIREDFPIEDIAVRFFSPCEVEVLRSLPPRVQADAFFNCWTRKEAYIKAIGEGLSCALDQFDVSLAPEEPAKLLAVRAAGQTASRWSMRNLDVDEGYKAALVVEGQGWELLGFRWNERVGFHRDCARVR